MSVKVLVAGDFCPQDRVANRFNNGDYASVLSGVKEIVNSADYSIINYECPVVLNSEKSILKSGPCLKYSEKGLEAVKWVGFNCVTLANNHFRDYGDAGVFNTVNACSKLGIDYVGGGRNIKDAARILYKKFNDITIAIINCCENEFSISAIDKAGSNPLNPIQQYYQITEAKNNADFVIVIVHGGTEFYQLPTPRMQEIYRFFVDSGANAVVNHHQHCYSGYEIYKGSPIVYGLGNFCFDKVGKRNDNWNRGYMVLLVFDRAGKTHLELYPYEQCNVTPTVNFIKDIEFSSNIDYLNHIINNPESLNREFVDFTDKNKERYLLALEPYTGHLGGLKKRKLIPSLLSKDYYLRLYGYLRCEAHFDRMIQILSKEIYENNN